MSDQGGRGAGREVPGQVITNEVITRCRASDLAEEWFTIVTYCERLAAYFVRLKGLPGAFDDLWLTGVSVAAFEIRTSRFLTPDELIDTVRTMVNRHAQREFVHRGRETNSGNGSDGPIRAIRMSSTVARFRSKTVELHLYKALKAMRAANPTYFAILRDVFHDPSVSEQLRPDTYRRAIAAFRGHLLAELEGVCHLHPCFDVLDELKNLAANSRKGSESFKVFLEEFFACKSLFAS